MNVIELNEAEIWQCRAMQAEIETLAMRMKLAQELQAQALTGFVQRHGGDTSQIWRTSQDGARLERVEG